MDRILRRFVPSVARLTYNPAEPMNVERIATLEAALELLGDDDSPTRARLLAHLAVELSFGADRERRTAVSDESMTIARRLGDRTALAEVLVCRSLAIGDPEFRAERLALADQQATLADALGDPVLAVNAAVNGVIAAIEANDRELTEARLERARQLADELGQPSLRWAVTVQEARLAALSGRFADAERLINDSLELGQAVGATDAAIIYAAQLYLVRYLQGRLGELAPHVQGVGDQLSDDPVSTALLAQVFVTQGDLDEARRLYEQALAGSASVAEAVPHNTSWLLVVTMMSIVCIAVGDRDRAPTFIDVLLPYADATVADRTVWGGSVSLHLGRLFFFTGRLDDAESALRDALLAHEQVGSLPMIAITKLNLAWVLLARGRGDDRGAGEALYDDARRICDDVEISFDDLVCTWPRLVPADAEATPATSVPDDVPDGILVGRDAELARLETAWRAALDGTARFVLVSGEPGIGKTRLLDEMTTLARDDRAIVLRGHSDQSAGGPYQPFIEALSQLVASAGDDELPRLLGRLAGELTRLLPAIADRLPGSSAPLQSDPDTERYRLFDAVAGWMRSTAASAPLVLILDDLQCAGRPTLQLLRHVAGSLADQSILVLGAYRDTEVGRSHPLSELLADRHRIPAVERVVLGALRADDVVALLEQQHDGPLDESTRALALRVHDEF